MRPLRIRWPTPNGGKRTRKRPPSPASSVSGSDSISPERRPPPKKRQSHRQPHKSKSRSKAKWKRAESAQSDPWQSETPESSKSSREEGELSGDEDMEEEESGDRFFPADMFPHLLNKAIQTLKLDQASRDPEAQPEKPAARFLSPQGTSKPAVVPFPQPFKEAMELEWKTPSRTWRLPRVVNKLYNLPEDISFLLKFVMGALSAPDRHRNSLEVVAGGAGEGVSCFLNPFWGTEGRPKEEDVALETGPAFSWTRGFPDVKNATLPLPELEFSVAKDHLLLMKNATWTLNGLVFPEGVKRRKTKLVLSKQMKNLTEKPTVRLLVFKNSMGQDGSEIAAPMSQTEKFLDICTMRLNLTAPAKYLYNIHGEKIEDLSNGSVACPMTCWVKICPFNEVAESLMIFIQLLTEEMVQIVEALLLFD
ncbi:hypothetical protein lerEdw1_005351 [Lerista edwardsae]|nr:hypothetical protein lerEdw1_005351 [Lerista edwardsae]